MAALSLGSLSELKKQNKHRYSIWKKIAGLTLLFLLFSTGFASFTRAETYNPILQWGSYGSGPGQFNGPYQLDVDSAGNVYVADLYNQRVQKFDSDGNFITEWGSYGTNNGQFTNPISVAIDAAGYVYVTDQQNSIQKFDSDGNFITKWGGNGLGDGQFSGIMGIAASAAGYVFVADFSSHRVQKFDSDGHFITKWGSYGSGNGQFSCPQGIAVDSAGYVYVADGHVAMSDTQSNNRVQKFDSDGNFITKWGSAGSGDGQFISVDDIAIDAAGYVYVADGDNHCVQNFTSNGDFIAKWSSSGQFNPTGIGVDRNINIYVMTQNTVQKFSFPWTCSLTASIGSYYDVSVFGTQVGSTTGFDQTSDAIDPPAPPAGVDSYFYGSDQTKLSTNIVQPSNDMNWSYRVKSVGTSGPMQLTWSAASIASIPERYFVLLLNSNGIPVADMRKTTQYAFSAASDVAYSFSVVVLSARTVSLDLNIGWNMVSFPVLPSDTSFASIFSGKGYYQVLTWTGTSYATPASVEVGRGYWVLVLSPTSLSLIGAPMTSFGVDLQSGWSMIGSVYGRTVGGGTVFSGYYQLVSWNGATYVDSKSVGIEPLKGYWALVLTPTHITVG